jgi:hypothetical protein
MSLSCILLNEPFLSNGDRDEQQPNPRRPPRAAARIGAARAIASEPLTACETRSWLDLARAT